MKQKQPTRIALRRPRAVRRRRKLPAGFLLYAAGVLSAITVMLMFIGAAVLSRLGFKPVRVQQTQIMVAGQVRTELFAPAYSSHKPKPLSEAIAQAIAQAEPFPPDVAAHIDEIFAVGQARGNRPGVFSLVGDSITVSPHFFDPIGAGSYALTEDYTHLAPVIDYYSRTEARRGNSFVNPSLSAEIGWAAWAALDPSMATSTDCFSGEAPIVCEYRLTQPSVALIMYGTNDVGYRSEAQFRADMQRIVDISIEMGVIPVLSTIPERPDVGAQVDTFNNVIRGIAAENDIPLWDYHAALSDLPNDGLASDNVHPSVPPGGGAAVFTEENLRYGATVRNLTGLEALYRVWGHLLRGASAALE